MKLMGWKPQSTFPIVRLPRRTVKSSSIGICVRSGIAALACRATFSSLSKRIPTLTALVFFGPAVKIIFAPVVPSSKLTA